MQEKRDSFRSLTLQVIIIAVFAVLIVFFYHHGEYFYDNYIYNLIAVEGLGNYRNYRDYMFYPLVITTSLMQLLNIYFIADTFNKNGQVLSSVRDDNALGFFEYWKPIFWRLRWLLLVIFLARLEYVLLLWSESIVFDERKLIWVRMFRGAPERSLVTVLGFGALTMAALLQPFVVLMFDTALVTLVIAGAKWRKVSHLALVVFLAIRISVTYLALREGMEVLDANGITRNVNMMNSGVVWQRLLTYLAQGDLSLRSLNSWALITIWGSLNNGIYVGIYILELILAQALLAHQIMKQVELRLVFLRNK